MPSDCQVTRRRFLQLASLVPLYPVLNNSMSPLPLAVFSKVYQELKMTFEESAEVTEASGLDGIDCAVRPGGEICPERAADEMPRYDEILRHRKVRMLLLTTGITGIASPNAETILCTARKLGVVHYRLGYWSHRPGTSSENLIQKVRAQLQELSALNRDIGVCALFQNHSAGKNTSSRQAGSYLAELREIVKDLNPDQIGVAFDLGHAILTHGDQWHRHFDALKPWIKIAYIKDVKQGAGFVPFGQGEFGRTDFFQRLRQMQYNAPLSIHIEFDWRPKNRETLVTTLAESRRVVRQWLDQASS